MVDELKSLLIKILPTDLKKKLKRTINSFKLRYPKVIIFFNGSFSTFDLLNEIDSIVQEDTEVIMFHTSMNNIKPMFQGNAKELLDALIEFTKNKNITLVFPGFVLGKNNQDIKEFYQRKKKFDCSRTPTTVGLINELFRRTKGVKRSSHPTHSVLALGPMADEIIGEHHCCENTFGQGSPFHKMENLNSIIIGLGTYYYRNLTHVHVAEDLLGDRFPYPIVPSHEVIPIEIILPNEVFPYKLKVFRKELSQLRRMNFLKRHISKGNLRQYKFKGTPIFVANPKEVTKTLLNLAEKGITIYNS